MREDKAICLSLSVVSFACVLAWCIAIACMGCDRPNKAHPVAPPRSEVKVLWFTSDLCGPCRRQAPVAEWALTWVDHEKIDVHDDPGAARKYGVRSVPAYIILIGGTEKSRTQDATELRQLLEG